MSENDERRKRVSRLQQIKDESEVDEATKRIMNLSLESEEQNSTNFLAKRLQKASANTSMNGPQRIQISRIDVDPPNTVRVCSPSPWSNPFRIGEMGAETLRGRHLQAVGLFTEWLLHSQESRPRQLRGRFRELKRKNLGCFCPLDLPCHADVLLLLANSSNRLQELLLTSENITPKTLAEQIQLQFGKDYAKDLAIQLIRLL